VKQQTSKIVIVVAIAILVLTVSACNNSNSKTAEDPLNRPFSIGPNDTPNVNNPTSNLPK
jgi:hypothetical protein